MKPFATTADLTAMWRRLTPDETERATVLLQVVSDTLREEGYAVGVDLDEKAAQRESFCSVLRAVTVDVTARALQTPTEGAPMTQTSQSALGYTVSGTYLVPGGGMFIKNSELARLGLRRQRMGVIEPYDIAQRYTGYSSDC